MATRMRALLTGIALGVMAGLAGMPENASARTVTGQPRVVDGDTLVIEGVRIRLEGIDAPELRQTCHDRRTDTPTRCGMMAMDALVELIGNRHVSCHLLQRDHHGRHVARCHVVGRIGGGLPAGHDLSAGMVMRGWALAYMAERRPDIMVAEQMARIRGLGIWSMRFETPADHRRTQRAAHGG